jgi:hypothetical protein
MPIVKSQFSWHDMIEHKFGVVFFGLYDKNVDVGGDGRWNIADFMHIRQQNMLLVRENQFDNETS